MPEMQKLPKTYNFLTYHHYDVFTLILNYMYMDFFYSPFGGVIGIIHLVLFIYALIMIIGSNMDVIHKIVWILIVGLFPLVGLIIYLLIGRKA